MSPHASASEIRSAFRDKVRASHPDTTAGAEDHGDVIAVVEAYRRLMAREEAAGRADPSVARRVKVRRARPGPTDRVESETPPSCPGCRGAGFVETSVTCPGCRGSGTITRLEAHRARVVGCRRCQGRGEGRVREVCPACRGSGIVPGPER